jgi:hypothetical protein
MKLKSCAAMASLHPGPGEACLARRCRRTGTVASANRRTGRKARRATTVSVQNRANAVRPYTAGAGGGPASGRHRNGPIPRRTILRTRLDRPHCRGERRSPSCPAPLPRTPASHPCLAPTPRTPARTPTTHPCPAPPPRTPFADAGASPADVDGPPPVISLRAGSPGLPVQRVWVGPPGRARHASPSGDWACARGGIALTGQASPTPGTR